MDIVKIFGEMIEKAMIRNPEGARRLLLAGYRTQRAALTVLPNRKLPPSKQYDPRVIMELLLHALARPESAAMVSLFTPCEPLMAVGITPYSVETLSGYIAGTKCEKIFLKQVSGEGMPETLCSFHKIFIGAADAGLLPKPRFSVYTNLACDANMMTFPYMSRKYEIPSFFIDVPYEKSEASVQNVARQLREMCTFVSEVTGRQITDEALHASVCRSARSIENYSAYYGLQGERCLTGDLTSEMYLVFMSHIMLGSAEAEKYSRLLLSDLRRAPKSCGKRLLWIHAIPFLQKAPNELLSFSGRAYITACDLACDNMLPVDPEKPYDSMARRMVYSVYNGSVDERIERALEMADKTKADGVIVFAHWGCKGTLGASQLIKSSLENKGLPVLVLDGDACDPANSNDGQTATRIEAFLELLEEKH